VDLVAKGLRCWFAPKDLKIGDSRPSQDSFQIRRSMLTNFWNGSSATAWPRATVRLMVQMQLYLERSIALQVHASRPSEITLHIWDGRPNKNPSSVYTA
jgi:hypothetical protein